LCCLTGETLKADVSKALAAVYSLGVFVISKLQLIAKHFI